MCFFDLNFWQDFVSNISATLLGALVGIPIALALNRWISNRTESKTRKQEEINLITRKIGFLDLLNEALLKNRKLVTQMKNELKPDSVIFYNVDTNLLDSTSSLKYDLIKDLELNILLDSIRYELGHLHRKVELQLEIEFSAFKAIQGYQDRRAVIIGAIHNHFPRIENEIDSSLKMIDDIKTIINDDFSKYKSPSN